jgi:NTP pyrophosphatase (non-canonical NTP hydrolase)
VDIDRFVEETRKTWNAEYEGEFGHKDVELLYAAAALGGEAGELQNMIKKIFRYKYYTKGHKPDDLYKDLPQEIADVLYYLCRIADVLEIDISKAFEEKMRVNRERYVSSGKA